MGWWVALIVAHVVMYAGGRVWGNPLLPFGIVYVVGCAAIFIGAILHQAGIT